MKFRRILFLIFIFSLFSIGNFVYAQGLTPNDPYYTQQWYLQSLNMPLVWNQETGEKDVIIAVIDSGIDTKHPDLHDNIWVNQKEILGDNIDNDYNGYVDDINGWDFVTNTNDPSPKYDINCLTNKSCIEEGIFHGTFVSGIAAAIGNNNLGITGISWHTKFMPLRVLNEDGSGNTQDVVRAIDYAINNKADIINLSFVGNTYDIDLQQTLEKAYKKGIVIVAAAGNENAKGQSINLDLEKAYPICIRGSNDQKIIIGVAASDNYGKLAGFSNYGSSCVDIIAPGKDFFGTLVYDKLIPSFNKYYGGPYSGTSLATPIVSGIAALMKSYNPTLTNQQIMDLILNNADNIDAQNPSYAGKLGKGLIDPVKIFKSLKAMTFQNQLIKGTSPSVYYYALDGNRYIFPDSETFLSWYDNFKNIKQISDQDLAKIPLGGVVTFRPGSLVKIRTDSKVYAVAKGGVLRWILSEDLARNLFGLNWYKMISDVPEVFFTNYKIGEPIRSLTDFNPTLEKNQVTNIDIDRGLM